METMDDSESLCKNWKIEFISVLSGVQWNQWFDQTVQPCVFEATACSVSEVPA